jgi:type VI secretion system protein ImpK
MKNNLLLGYALPFFEEVSRFEKNKSTLSLQDVQEGIKKILAEFEHQCHQANIPLDDISLASFALIVYFDEYVMNSDWQEKMRWIAKSLQWLYLGQHVGGEAFFKKLQELKYKGEEKKAVLEIYYLCLQLGFKGIYRIEDPERLDIIVNDTKNAIARYRSAKTLRLSPPIEWQKKVAMIGRQIPLWTLAVFVAVGVFLIYGGFSLSIHHVAHTAKAQIQEYEEVLP